MMIGLTENPRMAKTNLILEKSAASSPSNSSELSRICHFKMARSMYLIKAHHVSALRPGEVSESKTLPRPLAHRAEFSLPKYFHDKSRMKKAGNRQSLIHLFCFPPTHFDGKSKMKTRGNEQAAEFMERPVECPAGAAEH